MASDLLVPESTRTAHLELVLEMGAVGVWDLDLLTGTAWRNAQHDRIFGYDTMLPEWTIDTAREHVLPEDQAHFDESFVGSIMANIPWSLECRIRRPDGQIRWIKPTGRPVQDADGKPVKLIGHVIDITETKRNEEHLRTVLDELNHRVRNTLSVVTAIASRSFPDHVPPAQGRADFVGRIAALTASHDLLTQRDWTGADLRSLVDIGLKPYLSGTEPHRFDIRGPHVELGAKPAVNLSLALGELVTNAAKHGALSVPEGRVDLTWTVTEPADRTDGTARVDLLWREAGGPPAVRGPRTGFGMVLLERLMPAELNGTIKVDFHEGGLECRMSFDAPPLSTG